MNARVDFMCMNAQYGCILDPPQYEMYVASGRGGGSLEEINRTFEDANFTYYLGLEHRLGGTGPDSEVCAFGHTDVEHSNETTAGSCRVSEDAYDQCDDRPPPFVCVCVSKETGFLIQDILGPDQRFFYVILGLLCLATAFVMLALRLVGFVRAKVLRHCRRADTLRRLAQDEYDEGDSRHRMFTSRFARGVTRGLTRGAGVTRRAGRHKPAVGAKEAQENEMRELWRCASTWTFCVAIIGGPVILWVRLPKHLTIVPLPLRPVACLPCLPLCLAACCLISANV